VKQIKELSEFTGLDIKTIEALSPEVQELLHLGILAKGSLFVKDKDEKKVRREIKKTNIKKMAHPFKINLSQLNIEDQGIKEFLFLGLLEMHNERISEVREQIYKKYEKTNQINEYLGHKFVTQNVKKQKLLENGIMKMHEIFDKGMKSKEVKKHKAKHQDLANHLDVSLAAVEQYNIYKRELMLLGLWKN